MNPQIRQLLTPEILSTVNGLELVARVIVEGYMSGGNPSQSVGAGQEFSQYRSYEPGDDLRQLDWKMFARSERYYIKQSEIETNITVKFMLDASRSMEHAEGDVSKMQMAKVLIAALAFLARKQSDTFGLFSVNDLHITAVHPRFDQQQYIRFLNELIKIKAESTWKKGNGLEHIYSHQGKEMILFFTDMYDNDGDLQDFIRKLKTPRNEVIVFHLIGREELELSYSTQLTFEDLETGERLKVDSSAQQSVYRKKMSDWVDATRDWMLQKQVIYQPTYLDDPAPEVLRTFLKARKSMIR
ncbi:MULTISPECIES: DUF58 domain-containing protein [unclassified Imperialibacter]|uniref:DUF58 domain-containing protein n=1 Tax=unclassified Imperialibacter TaxID=2629706 RepID=UPI0012534509|nr:MULTISPECIES: DUF58 domain-containing protein [unclassified Imperialibacter]CAD5252548.1 DUF58 domain-containing protein [Imperialibacter sp. 89]CAD5260637.1 DUF58 domain-containing protein [Imperialibacter sp. 75]VVT04077.1 DUF58 domain-containing protein [Imperialibacter sp. EC-SDR9]